jgi:hypothetical protein
MNKPANYVKLVAFGPPEISDADAVSLSPHARRKTCAVSWVYPFTGKVEGTAPSASAPRCARRTRT